MVDEYLYREPTAEDIAQLAENLRDEDRKEVAGMTGYNFKAELEHCVKSSAKCWCCLYGDKVLAAFGVIPTNPMEREGIVWMLASRYTAEHKVYTGRWSKRGIQALLKEWDFLYNYVDKGNDETIKWLKWIGAEIYPPRPRGIYGLHYHLFVFRAVK